MKVFITGSTGYIGFAVAKAFRLKGHEVFGLARSQEKSNVLKRNEIKPILGDLSKPNDWLDTLEPMDVYIHAGFDQSGEGIEIERKTITELSKQIASDKLFIYTSGVWIYGNSENTLDEKSEVNPFPLTKWRPQHEKIALDAPCKTVVIRPATVFGKTGGLTELWFKSGYEGRVIQAGDGKNHWSLIHIDDLAEGYVLAALKGGNKEIYNLADLSNPTVEEITREIKEITGSGSVVILSPEKAAEQYGAFAQGLTSNQFISSEKARTELGFTTNMPPFLKDLKTYYEAWRTSQIIS